MVGRKILREEDLIVIGKVTKAYGLKGEIKVLPLTDFPHRFLSLKEVLIVKNGEIKKGKVERVKAGNRFYILKFNGFDTRKESEYLVGSFLEVERENLVQLPKNSFFVFDILGCEIINDSGEVIGKVKDVIRNSIFDKNKEIRQDIYAVESFHSKREILIPASKEFIKDIDIENKKIKVRLPSELLLLF